MLCPNCNQSLPEDSKFCVYCGTKLNPVPTPSLPFTEQYFPVNNSPRNSTRSAHSVPWIAIVLSLFVLFLLCGNIFLFVSNSHLEDDTLQKSAATVSAKNEKVELLRDKSSYDAFALDFEKAIAFYEGDLALVPRDSPEFYHQTYSCEVISQLRDDFYIMTPAAAKKAGYPPCPKCSVKGGETSQ